MGVGSKMLNAIVHFYETPGNCGENLNEKCHCHGNFLAKKEMPQAVSSRKRSGHILLFVR